MGGVVIYLSGCLCLLFLSFVTKLLNKICWTPIRIQSQMRSQGIKGPSYKFFHGNNKEIMNMKNEMIMSSSPMELSHQIFPITEPLIYSWIKLYGTNFLMWHGSQAELVVAEPKLIKEIMNENRSFPKREPREYLKLLGNGLVTTRGEKWLKKRKLAVNAFHAENLKDNSGLKEEEAINFMEKETYKDPASTFKQTIQDIVLTKESAEFRVSPNDKMAEQRIA